MTKIQAYFASIGLVVLGVAVVAISVLVIKNDALSGIGLLIAGTGAGGFFIPRPQDAKVDSGQV